MSEVKIPTCGRAVHYFPMDCLKAENNGKIKLPATVSSDSTDISLDLHVLYPNNFAPVQYFENVPHKSNWKQGQLGYWDWPEMK